MRSYSYNVMGLVHHLKKGGPDQGVMQVIARDMQRKTQRDGDGGR
jgi:hypothetical protein